MSGCPGRGAEALTQVCKEKNVGFFEKIFFLYFLLLLGFILESNDKNKNLSIAEFTFPFVIARAE